MRDLGGLLLEGIYVVRSIHQVIILLLDTTFRTSHTLPLIVITAVSGLA
jgi:hypothetical protein